MTQIAATTPQLAAWITEQARVHDVPLEALDAPTVAKQIGCTPQEASAAIAEAIAVRTAALRGQLTAANVTQGGARLQLNTPQTLHARANPQAHLQAAAQAFNRGDYAGEAQHLADYWNAFAATTVLGADLVPAAGAERTVPPNGPHAALLRRLQNEPTPYVRLQLVRDFVTPQKTQPDVLSRLTSGLGKLMSNPTGLMTLLNPTAALFMAATQQAQSQPQAAAQAPATLYDALMAKASAAYHQHRTANRHYPDAATVTPLVQRFSAAIDGLDERLRGLLLPAFELALQRGDGAALEQLTSRAETLAKETYDEKLKLALAADAPKT